MCLLFDVCVDRANCRKKSVEEWSGQKHGCKSVLYADEQIIVQHNKNKLQRLLSHGVAEEMSCPSGPYGYYIYHQV